MMESYSGKYFRARREELCIYIDMRELVPDKWFPIRGVSLEIN